jgi:hypothetical protein
MARYNAAAKPVRGGHTEAEHTRLKRFNGGDPRAWPTCLEMSVVALCTALLRYSSLVITVQTIPRVYCSIRSRDRSVKHWKFN